MSVVGRPLTTAACVGVNPFFFDAVTWEGARYALSFCAVCPITELCREEVLTKNPKSTAFDGVAGGLVWRNGAVVEKPTYTQKEKKNVSANHVNR
jgi:hypothetical protein